MRTLFGYPDLNVMTREWWLERVHLDDLGFMSQVSQQLRSGSLRFWTGGYRFRCADGSYAHVSTRCHVVFDAQAQPIAIIGAMMDITQQKAAIAAIEASQERLQALFDNALDSILLMDDEGYFIDGNPSACALFGYDPEELRRLHFTDLTPPPSDREAVRRWNEFEIAGKQAAEFTIERKGGELRDIEYYAARHIQPGINLVIVRDITERKLTERSLAENRERLERLSRRLVHAQEDERKRIARELHDEIGRD